MSESGPEHPHEPPDPRAVGLCYHCVHARRIASSRGSVFYRCGLADRDPRFPRYPPLPVVRCAGFRAKAE